MVFETGSGDSELGRVGNDETAIAAKSYSKAMDGEATGLGQLLVEVLSSVGGLERELFGERFDGLA